MVWAANSGALGCRAPPDLYPAVKFRGSGRSQACGARQSPEEGTLNPETVNTHGSAVLHYAPGGLGLNRKTAPTRPERITSSTEEEAPPLALKDKIRRHRLIHQRRRKCKEVGRQL
ncbi:hypothetical protein NDU88_008316 [Pleurodeles waltl]|uniref:Uncharacterized protein n=1 Tax=Pleurodeles waltl TaxID=8319 RepID=A0AAV7VUN5_PLEWA|nr:hypothetical protein NDU88_008316 [Pleurodeles waltl]